MNTELKEAIEALEKEKNIMRETLFEAIENALLTACKSNFGRVDNIKAWVDRDTFEYYCTAEKEVVETKDDVEDKLTQIALEDDPDNFILMHAMGANTSGQLGSVVAGGVLLALVKAFI